MMKSELSLEVSNVLKPKCMRVYDTSYYCPEEVIENYLIEVLPVNKATWVTYVVKKSFSLVLNSATLRYTKGGSVHQLVDLPDGIYEFKMSIKPNSSTIHHYYHLRTVLLERKLQSEYSKLLEEKCDLSKADYHANKLRLRDIEEYIRAAKWAVEECHDKSRGKELYEFAESLLKRYTNECKC